MTEQEYNNAEGIRRSDLWRMNESPEKFKWFLEHPDEQTPAMLFGSACHKMVLEPKEFFNEYAIAPQCDRRTNVGKETWAKFEAENAGKTVITEKDAATICEMNVALLDNELAAGFLLGEGQVEVPLFWTDPETGEKCKAKLDRLIKDGDGKYVIVDYKTAQSVQTDRFSREAWRLGYHYQAGFYSEGLKQIAELDYTPRFVFVAQEKKAPYAVNVMEVNPDVMNVGAAKFHQLLVRYHECKEVDMWPGYCSDVPNELMLPEWFDFDEEEE